MRMDENLRVEAEEQVKNKVTDCHHVHVLLDVEHVDLVVRHGGNLKCTTFFALDSECGSTRCN
jgi:hypothetical protein